jgi:AAA-like domain
MDFTPTMWAALTMIALTKAFEQMGKNAGDQAPKLLRQLTDRISQRLPPKDRGSIFNDPSAIEKIAKVVEDNPEIKRDIQSLSIEVNSDPLLVQAMKQRLQEQQSNYAPNIQPEIEKFLTQLENLEWELTHPPTPIDNLEAPYGVIPTNSIFYIEPDNIKSRCQQEITQPSGLLKIKAAPQMGKTSLLERLVVQGQGLNYRIIRIDLQDLEDSMIKDLDQFFQWLCRQISKQSDIKIIVNDMWDRYAGCMENCTDFIERYILRADGRDLLLCIDNLELIYHSHPQNYHEFLKMLRSWNQKKGTIWDSVRMIVLYVSDWESPGRHHSPFSNVGIEVGSRIEVGSLELNKSQVQNLVNLYGLNWQKYHIDKLMELVGGHPFLIRLALYEIAQRRVLLQTILITADREDGLYRQHLQQCFQYLEGKSGLKEIMRQIVHSDRPLFISSTLLPRLSDLGLIKYSGNNVEPANQLYRSYFRRRL